MDVVVPGALVPRPDRHAQPEGRAHPRHAVDEDDSLVSVGDGPDDREPKARSAACRSGRCRRLLGAGDRQRLGVLEARVGVNLCRVAHFRERSLVVKIHVRIGLLGIGVAVVQITADVIAVILISLVGVIGGHVLA